MEKGGFVFTSNVDVSFRKQGIRTAVSPSATPI
jgi:hypothetical protein